jgi:hypothetical protein
MSNYDPFTLASAISTLFPDTLPKATYQGGNAYAVVPRGVLGKIQGSKTNFVTVDQHALSRAEAARYSMLLQQRHTAGQIPWILGPLSLLPVIGSAMTWVTSSVDGIQRRAQGKVSPDQLSVLMAQGGIFSNAWSLAKDPDGQQRLVVTFVYVVTVGKEERSFPICSTPYKLASGQGAGTSASSYGP